MQLTRFRVLLLLVLAVTGSSLTGWYFTSAIPSPTRTSVVEPGSLVKGCRALVVKDGSQAVNLDGFTGINHKTTGTDDAVIQDAMDNILDSGRTNQEVVCLIGSFTIGAKLIVPSYTFLDMRNAKLTLASAVNDGMFNVNTKVFVTLYGGQLIGNRMGQVSGTTPLVYMLGIGGIYQHYRIDSVKITGCFNGCVMFDTAWRVWLVNSHIGDYYDTSNAGSLGALVKFNAVNEGFITNDQIESSQDGGGLFLAGGGNIHVTGTEVDGNAQYGIQISTGQHDVQITGGEVIDNSQSGAGTYPDIDIYGSYHIAITGVTMGGEAQHNIDRSGVRTDSGSSNNTFADNIIFGTFSLPIDSNGPREVISGGFYTQYFASKETQVFYYATGTATISAGTSVTVTNRMAKTPSVVFATPQSTGYGTFAVGSITATSFIISVATSGTYTFSWMEQV